MKNIFAIILVILLTHSGQALSGGEVGNGGDGTEIRFIEIANDIQSWIKNDGARYLKLPHGIHLSDYNTKMLALLGPNKTLVSFTSESVSVEGLEKTCKNFFDANQEPNIICNIGRFNETERSAQYQLVHHEFAGLAGFEINIGASSEYTISKQIAHYLTDKKVLRASLPFYSYKCTSIAKFFESDILVKTDEQIVVTGFVNYDLGMKRVLHTYQNYEVHAGIQTDIGFYSDSDEEHYSAWYVHLTDKEEPFSHSYSVFQSIGAELPERFRLKLKDAELSRSLRASLSVTCERQ
ncbi:MAG: hypothetical protein AB7I27_15265 [Bacteriovoracaceae bacterium]